MIIESILLISCLFILGGSIYISLKTRFVQLRSLKALLRKPRAEANENSEKIAPVKALFTAMSTTLGLSTIVAPTIAIQLGGPGALLFFLITSFFGSAATFTEVSLAIQHRKTLGNGVVRGGPMQYLEVFISPLAAKWYALSCLVLMMTWSGAQANQVAAILNSPLLGAYRIPTIFSAVLIAFLAILLLRGGIKRIGSFSSKLVPLMFVLYVGGSLWIVLNNVHQIIPLFQDMFQSALSPVAIGSGTLIGGLAATLRWGILKGTQACEAGIGTQAIPHSMAETDDPDMQGALAMLSTYTAGILAFLSGLVTLITKTWLDPDIPLGIGMVAASFEQYFPSFGVPLLITCAFLFGFGTILGNSYNGGHCFTYLVSDKRKNWFLFLTAGMIIFGALSDVISFWSYMDLVLAAMSIPHMTALLLYNRKKVCSPLTT